MLSNQFTPIVLTFRRPRLAETTIRHLIESEGVPAEDIILVINGEGGIKDAALQSRLDVLRLSRNFGPAGGFRAGLEYAVRSRATPWFYLMEDDAGLLDLPAGRAGRVIRNHGGPESHDIGAVVAYGRNLAGRTGRTTPHIPAGNSGRFLPVDLAAWGATLIRRQVIEAGILPDRHLYFGYEDFDFFLRMRRAGWRLVVDVDSELAVGHQVTDEGRSRVFNGTRPADKEEPWREYYRARNFLILQRRWGNWRWGLDHLLRSGRRWQLTGWDRVVGGAILRGLADGLQGRLGLSSRYQREFGEHGTR